MVLEVVLQTETVARYIGIGTGMGGGAILILDPAKFNEGFPLLVNFVARRQVMLPGTVLTVETGITVGLAVVMGVIQAVEIQFVTQGDRRALFPLRVVQNFDPTR